MLIGYLIMWSGEPGVVAIKRHRKRTWRRVIRVWPAFGLDWSSFGPALLGRLGGRAGMATRTSPTTYAER